MQKKDLYLAVLITLSAAGTYNAVVINGDSTISGDVKFAKRLDESLGVITPGREIATVRTWKKIPARVKTPEPKVPEVVVEAPVAQPEPEIAAAVQDDLNMTLMEVVHPKKWAKGLPKSDFSGSLQASGGVIESLNISLPENESVSVSFAEMSGNVFQFDHNGESINGLIYQVDQNNYTVTLTSGSLEGARFRFTQLAEEQPVQDMPETVAQNDEAKESSFNF